MEAYDFSVYRTIVDVGGGHGALLAHILERNSQSSGMLFDAASVITGTTGAIEEGVAQGRAEKVALELIIQSRKS
jgi:O-methyltransferase domain